MSLEATIERNTQTMEKLIAAWNALTTTAKSIDADVKAGTVTTVKAGGVKVIEVEAPKPVKPAPTQPAAETATPTPTEAAAPTAAVASPSEAISYEQVAAAITAMVKVDRARVVATLAKFGATKGTGLKPEQYADFIKELG